MGAAFSGAVSEGSAVGLSDLARLAALWPTLSEATRQQIMALAEEVAK